MSDHPTVRRFVTPPHRPDVSADDDATPSDEGTDGVDPSTARVSELHRRLLAVDSALTAAATHLTALAESVPDDPETADPDPDAAAEMAALVDRLETADDRLQEVLAGARTLRDADPDGADRAAGGDGPRSPFDDGIVRNRGADRDDAAPE
jgi:hypothetical protein